MIKLVGRLGVLVGLMTLGVFLAEGCAPAGVKRAEREAFSELPEAEGQVGSDAEFLYELSEKESCSSDDAYRGMLYFIDKSDTSNNFQERTARLVMHGVVDKDWKHNPSEAMCKGKVAYMFARALGIRGGVLYNISNANQRYALRELIYKGIIKSGSQSSQVSGAAFVGIMGRADDYRQKQSR